MNTKNILGIALLLGLLSCGNGENESDAYGNFETREIIVSAEANGKVIKLDIDEGQSLEKGIEVGLIDTTQLALNLDQLEAKRLAVQANLSTIDANVDVLLAQKQSIEVELDRIKKLIEDKAATQRQLDDITGKLDVVNSQIKSTEVQKNSVYAELKSTDAQIGMLKDQLKKCHIVNPINGSVLEKFIEPFELVATGKSIYKIADLSTMDLRVYVSGAQLPHVKIGQKVKVLIDESEDTNRELEGEITWISSKAEFTPKIIQTKEERVDLVYAVKVKVSNDGSIKIGMPGEIKF